MGIQKTKADIARSPQVVLNKSMDDAFEVVAVEILGYESSSGELKRITVTGDGKLKVAL